MHEVLVNRLGGLSLPRKSVVRLTDRPDMTLDVYRGRKTTIQPTMYHCIWAMVRHVFVWPAKQKGDICIAFRRGRCRGRRWQRKLFSV